MKRVWLIHEEGLAYEQRGAWLVHKEGPGLVTKRGLAYT